MGRTSEQRPPAVERKALRHAVLQELFDHVRHVRVLERVCPPVAPSSVAQGFDLLQGVSTLAGNA
jgi:hypothetical protein